MSGYADSVTRILLARGEAEARAAREQGDAWAGMTQQLGQIPGQVVQMRQQEQDHQQRRELQQQQIATNKSLEAERLQDVAGKQELTKQDAALRDYFAQLGDQDPDIKKVSSIVGPDRGVKIGEAVIAFRGLQRKEYDDVQTATQKILAGFSASTDAQRAVSYPHIKDELVKAGVMQPGDAPDVYDPQWYAERVAYGKAQAKAEPYNLPPGTQRRGANNELLADNPPDAKPPVNHMVTVPGPNGQPINKLATEDELKAGVPAYRAPTAAPVAREPFWVVRDGKEIRISEAQYRPGDVRPGTAGGGPGRAPTGAQNKVLGFFNRAKQAADDLETVETEIAGKGLMQQGWMATMPNFLQTQAGQTYTQAQRAFTEARLRKDSGAAIPEQEFVNDRQTYFVQPGDSPATLAQKKRARSAMLASMGFEAGPALAGFYGDDADGMVQGYRDAAKTGAPARGATGQPGTFSMKSPKTGKTYTFASQAEAATAVAAAKAKGLW